MTSTSTGRDLAKAGHTPSWLPHHPPYPTSSLPASVVPRPKVYFLSTPLQQGEPSRQVAPGRVSWGGGGQSPSLACQYENKSPQRARLKYIAACENKAWSVVIWRKDQPSKKRARRFKCRSWRHEGECRKWKGSQDFVRIREAISSRDTTGWVYIVLTFDQKQWTDKWAAYKGAVKCWDKLRKRMTRAFGKIEYIQTWEQHKNGWPHLNLLVHNDRLATLCSDGGQYKVKNGWLEPNAIASGFGMKTWIEPMRDLEAMSGYMTKLANKLTAELTDANVKDQVPLAAPRNFRRLRASRGLLPDIHKDHDYTGELVQRPIEYVEASLVKEGCFEEEIQVPCDPLEERTTEGNRGRLMRQGYYVSVRKYYSGVSGMSWTVW